MTKTDSRYEEDSLGAFCQLAHIAPDALQSLLDWINAPPNLQQFCAVIGNLLPLFELAQSSPLLPEFNLEEPQIAAWKSILQQLLVALPADLPSELQHLHARENVRPHGLIGGYSEYASLVASNPSYPTEQVVAIRYLHFIALASAAGYRQQITAGEVKQPTDCIYTGMLKIRDLEKPNKRPAFTIPNLTVTTTLAECQAKLEAIADEAKDENSQVWCHTVRGLIRAYRDGREGHRGRYQLKLNKVIKPRQLLALNEPEWIGETGTSGQPANLVGITTFISRPDEASCGELAKLGLSPEEYTTQSAVAFDAPGAPPLAQHDVQLGRLRSRGLLHGLILAAQALPDSWGSPTAYEIERLVRQLSSGLQPALKTVQPEDIPALQAILLLRLWTGIALDDLLALRLVPSLEGHSPQHENALAFIEDTATLLIPISSPSRQRGINPIDQALLLSPEMAGRPTSSQSSIMVSLPKTATAILQSFFHRWQQAKKRKTHHYPFQHCTTDFSTGIKAYLAYTNEMYATRWTETRLSHVMRQAIMQSSGDPVFVYLLTKQETGHAVVAAHYQCTDVAYLATVFQRANAWIISTVRDGTAPHQPPIEFLPQALAIGSPLGKR